MRLLIISDMPHYRVDGQIAGWGPTVIEIDHLARLFEEIVHIGFLYPGRAPENSRTYQNDRTQFVPLRPSGGKRLRHKLSILRRFPSYLRIMRREAKRADVIHVRAPANVSLLAMLWLPLVQRPKWIKYAGNWAPHRDASHREPRSYAFQRWWLARPFRNTVVTVNGTWPGQPDHVHSFYNPSIERSLLDRTSDPVQEKRLTNVVRLLFVGRIESPKGVDTALKVLVSLREAGVPVHLDLLGDSEQRPSFEAWSRTHQVADLAVFHGWQPHDRLAQYYAQAHILLLPTRTEGWPKVLSEGLAHGVVPIAGAVGAIPQYLETFASGRACPCEDVAAFHDAIVDYWLHPEQWRRESRNGFRAARHFTYDTYLQSVGKLLSL